MTIAKKSALWHCEWCGVGIGLGQHARVSAGSFYHYPYCWKHHLREQDRLARIEEERLLASRLDEFAD